MPFFTKVYSQKQTKLLVKGKPITGFMDGAPIKVTFDGGEVEKTEGTDGAGLNIATAQGGTISFTIRETSADYLYLKGLYLAQQSSSALSKIKMIPAVLTAGGGIVISLIDCVISPPGEFSTGDKKQGGIEFKVVGVKAV